MQINSLIINAHQSDQRINFLNVMTEYDSTKDV
jgi:hypothetical protein